LEGSVGVGGASGWVEQRKSNEGTQRHERVARRNPGDGSWKGQETLSVRPRILSSCPESSPWSAGAALPPCKAEARLQHSKGWANWAQGTHSGWQKRSAGNKTIDPSGVNQIRLKRSHTPSSAYGRLCGAFSAPCPGLWCCTLGAFDAFPRLW